MKIRAKANGNILDLPDAEARPLVEAGIFDVIEIRIMPLSAGEKADENGEDDAPSGKKRTYKRRDVKAED